MEASVQDLDPKHYFNQSIRVFAHERFQSEALQVQHSLQSYPSHIAVFSSGTTSSDLKGYALSLAAMKANAQAVNDFYSITSDDQWGLSIPDYHIGGLAVMMRALLLGTSVVDCRGWDPSAWTKKISERKVTVTTVVPTQIYDLVQHKLHCPKHLRLLIVGGDYLSFELQKRAMALGWPIKRTYGMTEVGSQLASALDQDLKVLPIHQVKTDDDGRLLVKSPSLFSAQFRIKPQVEVKPLSDFCDQDGFYLTQDRVQLSNGFIEPKGRMDEVIKVAGHLTHLPSLRETLYSLLLNHHQYGKAEISIQQDDRKGNKLILIHLADLSTDILNKIKEAFHPYQIDEIKAVTSFERTDLGKLKKQ